ncbi:MAG: hypothetical protein RLZZ58_1120 [Pseudomonadota bacterium]
MRRLVNDIVGQAAPIIVSLADRIVLTAVLVRTLGVAEFEYWTVSLAMVAVLAMIDSGCLMNFSNEIVKSAASGDRARAVKVYRQSNLVFTGLGIVLLLFTVLIASLPGLQARFGLHQAGDVAHDSLILLLLGTSVAVKLCLSNTLAIYRVTQEFGRGTWLQSFSDIARLVAVGAAVIAGGGLLGAASAYALVTLGTGALILVADIGRRHPDFRFALALPTRDIMHGAQTNIAAFGIPYIAVVTMAQGPIMFLSALVGAGAGVVTQFVLLRTISNLCRMVLSKITNILGMEFARHHFAGREAHVAKTLNEIEYYFAMIIGIISGFLIGHGEFLLRTWVGAAVAYDPAILMLLMAPILIFPTYLLHSATIQYANAPMVWTLGSLAQIGCAVLIYALAADLAPLLRVTLAVSLSEILCLSGPIALISLYGISRRTILNRIFGIAVAIGSGAAVYGTQMLVAHGFALDGFSLMLAQLSLVCAVALLFHRLWFARFVAMLRGIAQ